MAVANDQQISERVRAMKALAHPTRLHIVQELAKGPQCVSDLHGLTEWDLSTVSKHLVLLRQAGWVRCEKRGQHVIYELACPCLDDFLRCIDSLCDQSFHSCC